MVKKKAMIFCSLMIFFIFHQTKIYGITEKFNFVIETVGIPRLNSIGKEINEEIYNTYNIFAYGSPLDLVAKDSLQRWANSSYGFWTKNAGSYKGSGTRGEYYLLGYSYSGSSIRNYFFPMDSVPTTTPDKWTFYSNPGATESWSDKSKYKYEEQLNHMKNSKLMFNDLSSKERAMNPSYIKEYNVTASSIGLNLAKLDAAATWRTYGVVHTRRKISGIIYSQVFLVAPMAANANIKNSLNVSNNYVLSDTEDMLTIPIKYDCNVINMSGYANEKHIKNIASKLQINGVQVDEISGSKTKGVGNQYMLLVDRDKFPPNRNYEITVKLDSYMHTEFAVDGLMTDITERKINLYVEPKLSNPVTSKKIGILSKRTENLVVSPLAQINNTVSKESYGITEAGKNIIIKLKLEIDKSSISNIKLRLNDKELTKWEKVQNDFSKVLCIKLNIPISTEPSLYGINSLRRKNKNYFKIDQKDIGNRITEPHKLTISFEYKDKKYQEDLTFDTIDDYIMNINTTIKDKVINADDVNILKSVEEWIQ